MGIFGRQFSPTVLAAGQWELCLGGRALRRSEELHLDLSTQNHSLSDSEIALAPLAQSAREKNLSRICLHIYARASCHTKIHHLNLYFSSFTFLISIFFFLPCSRAFLFNSKVIFCLHLSLGHFLPCSDILFARSLITISKKNIRI